MEPALPVLIATPLFGDNTVGDVTVAWPVTLVNRGGGLDMDSTAMTMTMRLQRSYCAHNFQLAR